MAAKRSFFKLWKRLWTARCARSHGVDVQIHVLPPQKRLVESTETIKRSPTANRIAFIQLSRHLVIPSDFLDGSDQISCLGNPQQFMDIHANNGLIGATSIGQFIVSRLCPLS